MPKSKYAEIVVPTTITLPPHLTGMEIVSDYTSNGKRHLFARRPEPEVIPATPAKKSPAKKKSPVPVAKKASPPAKADALTPSPATSFQPPFPGGEQAG